LDGVKRTPKRGNKPPSPSEGEITNKRACSANSLDFSASFSMEPRPETMRSTWIVENKCGTSRCSLDAVVRGSEPKLNV
jgi:hypothetical protein